MFTVTRSTARLLAVLPLAALLAAACETNLGPKGPPPAGQLAAIAVTPNPARLPPSSSQQFVAHGTDINGAVILFVPTWSVVANGGSINPGSGMFAAGATLATFGNTVRACNNLGNICGFATVVVANTPPVGPQLGKASTYGILAGSTVTCAGAPGTINADVGVFPGSTTTGFPPCTITGLTHLADATSDSAQQALTVTYNALAGMACGTTITADMGGTTIPAGVYCSTSSIGVTGTLTLDGGGDANALFVIQAASTLTTGTIANIALINGAQAKNVWFQVGSSATLGTGTTFRGNIVALTSITLVDNATLLGRALARNGAVSLGTNNSITLP
jgi:hypothetical protein